MSKINILIVKNDKIEASHFKNSLKDIGYNIIDIANNSEDALEIVKNKTPNLVLMDINLKGKYNGVGTANKIYAIYNIPVIFMIESHHLVSTEKQKIIESYGFVVKPFNIREIAVIIDMAIRKHKLEVSLKETSKQLEKTLRDVVQAMAMAVEARDPYTAGHQVRVGELAEAIAIKMELPENKKRGTYIAGLVHDIGKLAIPAEILSKPRELTDIEFELMKTHTATGYNILNKIDFSYPIADIVYQHHENEDGTGYPQGLKSNEILLEAKIIHVADVVEAMVSHRPYRKALGIDSAFKYINEYVDKYFDIEVVNSCISVFKDSNFDFTDRFSSWTTILK